MLQIYEILDRFELLYPDNDNLINLRRSYIDKDLNSIFRLTDGNEELRKAVVEKNLHSIFRLLGEDYDDLRKAVVEKNLHSLFRLLQNSIDKEDNTDDIRRAIANENLHSIFRLLGEDYDDLRKAVMQENLNSIFRLLGNSSDDLRKAVMQENLNSIFRLLYDEEMRKLLVNNNIYQLYSIIERYCSTEFIAAFKNITANEIDINNDCFSRGQLKSKIWLVEELTKINKPLGIVYLCAGWYGTLATMILESKLKVDQIRSFDLDTSCPAIAEIFNKKWVIDKWKFKATTKNILDIDYKNHCYETLKSNGESCEISESPTTIINTSCEHIAEFDKWFEKIPLGKLVVLQTNNFFSIKEHVNCSSSIDDFSENTPMQKTLFEGELDLGEYKRFMKIGIR